MRGRSRIPFDRHPLAMLLGAFVVVGVLAAIVVLGPGRVFHLLVSFLLPMVVILLVLLATVAVSSGLLWRHYRRIDSYGSPLETVFMAVFTLCAALAAVTVLPALFAS